MNLKKYKNVFFTFFIILFAVFTTSIVNAQIIDFKNTAVTDTTATFVWSQAGPGNVAVWDTGAWTALTDGQSGTFEFNGVIVTITAGDAVTTGHTNIAAGGFDLGLQTSGSGTTASQQALALITGLNAYKNSQVENTAEFDDFSFSGNGSGIVIGSIDNTEEHNALQVIVTGNVEIANSGNTLATAGINELTAIKIEQKEGEADWEDSTHDLININGITATVTGLTINTTYSFRLVVTGGSDNGNSIILSVSTITAEDLDQVNDVIALITYLPAIEDLVLADQDSIVEARTAYDLLTESQKLLVLNIADLEALEAEITAIGDAEDSVTTAEGLSGALVGDGSDDQVDINAAQTAHNTAENLVGNLLATTPKGDLEANLLVVQGEINTAQDAMQAIAQVVIDEIDTLPAIVDLMLADQDSIVEARTAYDLLTESQKLLVSNIESLEDLEAQIIALTDATDAVITAEAHDLVGDGSDSQAEIDLVQEDHDSAETLVNKLIATGPKDFLVERLRLVQVDIDEAQDALDAAKGAVDKLFTLSTGWNLVSVEALVDSSEFIGGLPTKIYKFVEGSYLTADLNNLTPLDALFIEVLDERYLGVNYDNVNIPTQTSKSLVAGWNVISIPNSMHEEVINTALNQLILGDNTGLTTVYAWNLGNAVVQNNWAVNQLSSESGYWVHMNSAKEDFALFVNPQ